MDEDPGFGVVGADGMPKISERAEGVRDARRLARMLRARCARGLRISNKIFSTEYTRRRVEMGVVCTRVKSKHTERA